MEDDKPPSPARLRVLAVAGRLFSERGYAAVTLRDIAQALGVRQPALYYHVPGGKEDLFVEVTQRTLDAHRSGITQALDQTRSEPLAAQLRAVAAWLLGQPPLDLARLYRADLPALSPERADALRDQIAASLLAPLQDALQRAYQRGEVRLTDPHTVATVLLTSLDAVHDLHRTRGLPAHVIAQDVIDIFLSGIRR